MIRIISGIFLVLHGMVHLLYLGQSSRLFELQPDMKWPDGAWTLSRVFGDETTRMIASVMLVIAAIGFAAGGTGLLFKQEWGRVLTIGIALFSSLVYLLLWDGTFHKLDNQGGVGILINLVILAGILIWPGIEF